MFSDTHAPCPTPTDLPLPGSEPMANPTAVDAAPAGSARGPAAQPPLPYAATPAALAPLMSRLLANSRRAGDPMGLLWVEPELLEVPSGDTQASAAHHDLMLAAGQRLRQRVRGVDEVFVVGTHAFAVLLKGAGTAEAQLVADRITRGLGGAYGLADQRLQARVRAGIATFPECGRTGQELAEAARRQLAPKTDA